MPRRTESISFWHGLGHGAARFGAVSEDTRLAAAANAVPYWRRSVLTVWRHRLSPIGRSLKTLLPLHWVAFKAAIRRYSFSQELAGSYSSKQWEDKFNKNAACQRCSAPASQQKIPSGCGGFAAGICADNAKARCLQHLPIVPIIWRFSAGAISGSAQYGTGFFFWLPECAGICSRNALKAPWFCLIQQPKLTSGCDRCQPSAGNFEPAFRTCCKITRRTLIPLRHNNGRSSSLRCRRA